MTRAIPGCGLLLAVWLSSISAVTGQDPGADRPLVRVFVLAGQSNMQGHAVVDLDHPEHYNSGKGTLQAIMADSALASRFAHLKTGDQWTVRNDVWVQYETEHGTRRGPLTIGFSGYEGQHHFGPELQFGHVVGDHFDEPVLLIKTAWGGKSLQTDFRPPGAGGTTGPCYQQMLDQVATALDQAPHEFAELANAEFEISGFVWQQGWNDMISEEATAEYNANLTHLINDLRIAWNQPDLPVVVGELGNGGPDVDEPMKRFRRAQSRIAAHPPFVGNVAFAPTAAHARPAEASPNVGHGHHWFGNAESYLLVGESLGQAMIRLLTQPAEPRVLILGDSISMGYTPFVKQTLVDEAFVVRPMSNHRNAQNCQGTLFGIEQIDRWLSIGGGEWDVIHFNFGLHDLKHVDPETRKNSSDPQHPEQSPPDRYAEQLREIVGKLKATGAKLIFATTTPVPEGGVRPFRDVAAPQRYNEIARRVMEENDVAINDLFAFANERLGEIQKPIDVHFTREGSQAFAEQVVQHIRAALASRQ